MTDESLISGTSMYKDKLGQKVADTRFNLYSRPVSDEIAERYFVTDDGFETQNCTLIDKGILKSFLLSQYGANKTGREKAVNGGGAYIVDPGDTSFEDMVKSIDKGMLVCRFAGGLPSSNGDFSGIAANSYYIENGKIQYPVSEASISGNFAELLLNIKDISKERVDFGGSIFPWISATNIAICGR
jgi:PmbA protein